MRVFTSFTLGQQMSSSTKQNSLQCKELRFTGDNELNAHKKPNALLELTFTKNEVNLLAAMLGKVGTHPKRRKGNNV